jgi:hypothetical protein
VKEVYLMDAQTSLIWAVLPMALAIGSAQAATITTLDKNGDVTGIKGLMIGTTTYDVKFYMTYNPVAEDDSLGLATFRNMRQPTRREQSKPKEAAKAIVDFLDAQQKIPTYIAAKGTERSQGDKRASSFFVFFDLVDDGNVVPKFVNYTYRSDGPFSREDGKWGAPLGGTGLVPSFATTSTRGREGAEAFAGFVAVPEPASLFLIVFGLVVLGVAGPRLSSC